MISKMELDTMRKKFGTTGVLVEVVGLVGVDPFSPSAFYSILIGLAILTQCEYFHSRQPLFCRLSR